MIKPAKNGFDTVNVPAITRRFNKAETATIHRISRLFDATPNPEGLFDLEGTGITIHVVTTARLVEAVQRLQTQPGKVYVALTNKDGVDYAMDSISEAHVGIMDPHGRVVRESQV